MFSSPSVNLYVRDVQTSAAFYRDHFGFAETFRTPAEGQPIHVELRLEGLVLGLASAAAARETHGLVAGEGPSGDVTLWTDDVDTAHAALVAAGAPSLSAPHDFLDGALRAGWVADPDGNAVQVVQRRRSAP
jgi:catechol 2,3-dioxygenase-like lactoylglutathione lyase family enzyme